MQNQKISPKLWITCMFLCMVVCFDIIAIITPDRTFSETENRMLAGFPEVSAQGLSDGSAGEQTEKYLSDQFAFRDMWASISFFARSRLLRQNEMNGVYLGKDGYLMLIPAQPKPESLQQKIDAINAVAEQYGEIRQCAAVIPNAVTVMTGQLPDFAPASDQPRQLAELSRKLGGITFCDVTKDMLSKNTEDLFYHTDHHWTSLGAYTAFRSMAPSLAIDPDSAAFDIYTVSDSFQGTLASKSGSHGYYDTIEIYVPQGERPLSVRYSDAEEARGTIYQKEFLDGKDKYGAFLDGTHNVQTVFSKSGGRERLLVVKDSFANILVPYLSAHFDLVVVNLSGGITDVTRYAEEFGADRALVVYNWENLITNTYPASLR